MLGRPLVPGPVPGRPPRQVPQHGGGPAREAADQAGEGGVHAGRAGQRPPHVGRPGQRGVAPVVGQVPQDVSHVGGGEFQPGVPEGQPGGLPAGPHQHPSTRSRAEADGQELVAGAGKRRRVRRPMPTGRKRRPGVMLHPSHPPTRSRCRFGVLLARRPAARGTRQGVRQSDGEPQIPGIRQARSRGQHRAPGAELARRAYGPGQPRACGPARPDPCGGADRTPSPALAGGACSRWRAGRWIAGRRRSLAGAHGSRDSACLRLEREQAGCYDQAASRGPLPRGCGAPGRVESAPVAAIQNGRGRHGGARVLADLLTGRAVNAAHAVGSSGM
jgi:hypothetical protein